MNIDQLQSLATTQPFGRGSTSRFRLAGGTLWYKDDKGYFTPLLSHGETFIADWGHLTHWDLDISSRAYNQMTSLHSSLKMRWLKLLGAGHGPAGKLTEKETYELEDEDFLYPAVSIRFKFANCEAYRVKKPTLAATKMLLRGRHPEDNSGRVDWSLKDRQRKRLGHSMEMANAPVFASPEEEINPYRDLFHPAFEEATASLAYGAVSKENTLRDLTQTLGQLKGSLDTSANRMVGELRECAERCYTPVSAEVAGVAEPHLNELVRKMEHFKSLAYQCRTAAEIVADVSAAPDSRMAVVTAPTDAPWDVRWPSTISSLEDISGRQAYARDPYGIAEARYNNGCLRVSVSPEFIEIEDETYELPPIEFTEHNIRGLSYYWVRRYKKFYEDVLGKIDCSLPDLFGKAPEEWDYLELAAPIFAAQ